MTTSNELPILHDIEWHPETRVYLHDYDPVEDQDDIVHERRWCFVYPDNTWTEFYTIDGELTYHLEVSSGGLADDATA